MARNPSSLLFIGGVVLTSFLSLSYAESLAGRIYNRAVGMDFSINPPNEDFAGIAFNPITQTHFVTDNKTDKVFQIAQSGAVLQTVDISGLKSASVPTADAEGITWMSGNTYGLALHDGKELAVVTITPATTILTRAEALIYDMSGAGKPKGLYYHGAENVFYWVTKDLPKQVVKGQINPSAAQMQILSVVEVDNLPVTDLADVTMFRRLTPHFLLLSESSRMAMEVSIIGGSVVLRSAFSTASWPIPKAGGLAFTSSGNMVIVGKQISGNPEDDFNVFTPTGPISNLPPVPTTARVLP